MEFFSLKKAPISDNDVVFRETWLSKLFGLFFYVVATGVAGWFWWENRSWWTAIFVLLFLLLDWATLNNLRHALHPSNWLVRRQTRGLLIKYRTYLNERMPEDDDVVFWIAFDEIESACKTSERRVQPGMKTGEVDAYNYTYLELKPKSDDLTELEAKLQAERSREAVSRWLIYPVTVQDGVIRLIWKSLNSHITPSLDSALASISATGQVRVRSAKEEQIDLVTDPETRAKREDAIRQLIQTGDRLAAITVAQKYFECSMGEASEIVENLAAKPSRETKQD